MARTRGAVWLFGLLGVVLGAALVYWAVFHVHRPPDRFHWPVPQVAKQVRPSVTVVFNYGRGPGGEKLKGMGTGVVINSGGDIVTNYHVVAGATRVDVMLSNGRRYTARVVGSDPPTDLAVIHIAPQSALTPIQFAQSNQIVPGDLVVAIGNSLGLTYSVTAGVVSSEDRLLHRDGFEYHLIQTDAAINPGNSGGPLVNLNGRLIGINSSKISQPGVEGIGFAIPSNVVHNVVDQILRYGQVRRPWMGMVLQDGPAGAPGLLVVSVNPAGPAGRVGIRPGDFLVKLGGHSVRTLADVTRVLMRARIGQAVSVELLRASRTLAVELRLGSSPAKPAKSLSGTGGP